MSTELHLICHRCELRQEAALGTRCPACSDRDLALVLEEQHRRFPDDPLLGRVLGGKYPLLGLLGRGGMGAVYRAIQEPVGREVAVKVIRSELPSKETESLRARFFREGRAVASLSHAAAVTLYDYGQEPDGILYMVLELLRGRDLNEVIANEGPMAPARAVTIVCQVLGALHEAHGVGLVHRDLKPHNIKLLGGSGPGEQAKVLDFGIAKLLRSTSDEARETFETRQGMVLGTPHYMAPEQAIGRNVGPRTDLYAMGVVLYELLAGTVPFDGQTPMEVLMAHQIKPVPPLAESLQVPPALQQVLACALAKDPAMRWPDALAMAEALTQSLQDPTGIPSLPVAQPRRSDLAGEREEAARLRGGTAALPTEDAFDAAPLEGSTPGDRLDYGHGETLPGEEANPGSAPAQSVPPPPGTPAAELAGPGPLTLFAAQSRKEQPRRMDPDPTLEVGPTFEDEGPAPRSRGPWLLGLAGLLLLGGVAVWQLGFFSQQPSPPAPAPVVSTAPAVLPPAPVETPPTITPAATAKIPVTSIPDGAVVKLDGVALGKTPFDWSPPPGGSSVALVFSLRGFKPTTITVAPGPGIKAHAVLVRRPAGGPGGRALPQWEQDEATP